MLLLINEIITTEINLAVNKEYVNPCNKIAGLAIIQY
jgi:hypothetical protein